MASERLDKHGSKKAHELFDENTAQVGSLGEVVDKHAGDSISLTDDQRSPGGADGGEQDFVAEMNPEDPSAEWEELDDEYAASDREDSQGIGETDITGTAAGIARGFGSHLPQDLGSGGFEIEEIPRRALRYQGQPAADEELDDYDDDDPNNGKYDPKDLEELSIPGAARVRSKADDDDESPDRVPVKNRPAKNFDQDIDSSTK
jgi:hypothetical protein